MRRALYCLMPVVVSMFALSTSHAQTYPAKPIHLVVPLAPGGGSDLLARYIGKHLAETLGQPVIIENRAGGGGLIGGDFVMRSAPDGYTLLMGGSGQIAVGLSYGKQDSLKDFTPITIIGDYPSLLVAHPSLPVKTVRDVIAFAKARPGQLNYGSAGNGSAGHLTMEMFRSMAGIDMVHVPYKGAAPAQTETMAGQVSLLFNNPLGALPYVRAGRLRAIGGSGTKRMSSAPDIPTIAESGLPGFDATLFLGIVAPAATPREIVTRIAGDVIRITQRREVQEWLSRQGMEAVGSTPEEYVARTKVDVEKLARVIRNTSPPRE